MNRNGQQRGMGRGKQGQGRGRHVHGEASRGHERRGRGSHGRHGMGWQVGPRVDERPHRPISEFIDGLDSNEKKAWLENFKAHLNERMSEVDKELGKL